jgi:hypothetical protein
MKKNIAPADTSLVYGKLGVEWVRLAGKANSKLSCTLFC